ncbi:DUF6869 domain-containing protein [Microbulbifer variabilis]|uniref:DUF6869 domain-containing protein n=1 Tax=Microbulbifer variabilis TaxID=266805 RepID=UPI00037F04A5|nr:hypothetical protein [Microbulbifer variabilis]
MSKDWDRYTDRDKDELAESWFTECEHNDMDVCFYRDLMCQMYVEASDNFIWSFIHRALVIAHKDSDLEQLAAGPMEHFLAKYGDEWIDEIEMVASKHYRFARLLTGSWKTSTSDHVWRRVEAIQEKVHDPLPW